MSEYQTFSDPAYFDMWCVREVGCRDFNKGWHLVNGDEAAALVSQLNTITDQRDRLIAALTPSGDTKAAYMGEVRDEYSYTDEEGYDHTAYRPVSWTAIKDVMALIRKEGGL